MASLLQFIRSDKAGGNGGRSTNFPATSAESHGSRGPFADSAAVLQVKGRRNEKLKKRYATLMLGATLALGGVGIPFKMLHGEQPRPLSGAARRPQSVELSPGSRRLLIRSRCCPRRLETAAASFRHGSPHENWPRRKKKRANSSSVLKCRSGDLIYREAKANDLSPEFVAAVVQTESHFKPNAVSQMGAQGLMQLVPRDRKMDGRGEPSQSCPECESGSEIPRNISPSVSMGIRKRPSLHL